MMDHDEVVRVRLGATTTTPPEVLQQLAGDRSVTVRATLALNPAAPPPVNHALARDSDERVRALLARKLASLTPTLSGPAQAALRQQALTALTTLVSDEAVRVRAAIAEELKDMPDIPRELIMRLAQDEAIMVCEPVILFSPMLSQEDLVALVAGAVSPVTVQTVARREGIGETVSDAIAATANDDAIRALLSNRSAQIREATLDALVGQAVEHVSWQEPLVRRPNLSPRALRALPDVVADHLMEVLAQRADIEPQLATALRQRVAMRLEAPRMPAEKQSEISPDAAMVEAKSLASAGRLTEDVLLNAARRGEIRLVAALLAVKAGTPISVVDRAASLRSAKGLISLTWKAGFSMRSAVATQTLLAKLAPNAQLTAGPGGAFPLSVEEMRWQLDFLSGARRG